MTRYLTAAVVAQALAACATDPATPAPTTTTGPRTTMILPDDIDLNCGDPGTSPGMTVEPGDPHHLDLDGDGTGCETT